MPEKSVPETRGKRGRFPWKKFWREWGIYLLAALVIVGAIVGLRFLVAPSSGRLITEGSPTSPAGELPTYRLYFTQGLTGTAEAREVEQDLLADIASATESVELSTPALDLISLTNGLVAAHERGVEVRVLENADTQNDPAVLTATTRLRESGVRVAFHPNEGALGGTFVVVDKRVVWAGSWALSEAGLQQDAAYVVRWQVAEMAQDFRAEFDEMFIDRAFGPTSPANTPHSHVALLDGGSIAVYMMPEDTSAYEEILLNMVRVQEEIIVLAEGLSDIRLEERLIGESSRAGVRTWGIVGGATAPEELNPALKERAVLRFYSGRGKMGENVIVLDGTFVAMFSQPLVQEAVDRNDGYIIIIRDPIVGRAFQREFDRLFRLSSP